VLSVAEEISRALRRRKVRRHAKELPPAGTWSYREPAGADERQEEAFVHACRHLQVARVGEMHYGFAGKSAGAAVRDQAGTVTWLKVDALSHASGPKRDAQLEADSIPDIPKPKILQRLILEQNGGYWRLLQMTLAPARVLGTHWLTGPLLSVEDSWLAALRQALTRVSGVQTDRVSVKPKDLATVIRNRFGRRAVTNADEWRTAHGDMNWANVTAPELMLLDWEVWGAAPRGYDAAKLLSYSFADRALFGRLQATFADDLNTRSGLVSQLYHYAIRLDRIERRFVDPREYSIVEAEVGRLLRM
jgi:hypothetical protein